MFNEYFLQQCKVTIDNSTLPLYNLITNSNLASIIMNHKHILDIIKNINVNNAHGPDNISGRMIEFCGDNITLPLTIIFTNIINTEIFPS